MAQFDVLEDEGMRLVKVTIGGETYALLEPFLEVESVSLRRDVERLVQVVAASLLARHAPGVVVDAYARTRLESGGRRRYSLEKPEIDALIDRAMPQT